MKNKLLLSIVSISLLAATSVLAIGGIAVEPTNVQLAAKKGTNITTKLNVISAATFDQSFKIESDDEWITPVINGGLLRAKSSMEVALNLKTKDLAAGLYVGQVKFSEVSDDPRGGSIAYSTVTLRVYEAELKLDIVPRSLEVRPGQLILVTVINSNDRPISLELESDSKWITVLPGNIYLGPGEFGAFIVRVSRNAGFGGLYRSIIKIQGDGLQVNYPIATKVDSGIDFNPPELGEKGGQIMLTNKLKRSIIVDIPEEGGLYSVTPPGKFLLDPGEKKTLTVKFEGEKKPTSLTFMLTGALLSIHIVNVR